MELEDNTPSCQLCRWSIVLWGGDLSCRRFPPVPVRQVDSFKTRREWPVVEPSDHCGEFKDRRD